MVPASLLAEDTERYVSVKRTEEKEGDSALKIARKLCWVLDDILPFAM